VWERAMDECSKTEEKKGATDKQHHKFVARCDEKDVVMMNVCIDIDIDFDMKMEDVVFYEDVERMYSTMKAWFFLFFFFGQTYNSVSGPPVLLQLLTSQSAASSFN
jgi:hypothetical protein